MLKTYDARYARMMYGYTPGKEKEKHRTSTYVRAPNAIKGVYSMKLFSILAQIVVSEGKSR